jgi:hypothetical protein
MNQTTLMAAGAMMAIVVGGAVAIRPSGSKEDPRAVAAEALAPCEARVASLEARAARTERDLEAAGKQIAEATATGLEAKREIEKLRAQNEDLLAMLGGGAAPAKAGAKAGSGAASEEAAALASASGASTGGASGSSASSAAPRLGAMAGGAATPEEVAAVKSALDQIHKQEQEAQQAQRDQRRKEMQQQRIAQLQQRLGLDQGQVDKISAIYDDAEAKRQDLMQTMAGGQGGGQGGGPGGGGRGGNPDLRQAMQDLRTQEQQEITAVLTPQQQADYQVMQQEQQQQRGGRGGRGGFGGGGAAPAPGGTTAPAGGAAGTGTGTGRSARGQ